MLTIIVDRKEAERRFKAAKNKGDMSEYHNPVISVIDDGKSDMTEQQYIEKLLKVITGLNNPSEAARYIATQIINEQINAKGEPIYA